MESRKLVDSPVQEGPVKAKVDDFEDPPRTDTVQKDDDILQAKPPGSYGVPSNGDGRESGERH